VREGIYAFGDDFAEVLVGAGFGTGNGTVVLVGAGFGTGGKVVFDGLVVFVVVVVFDGLVVFAGLDILKFNLLLL
jgi:hypothetical protein